jgi:hypothetical protein
MPKEHFTVRVGPLNTVPSLAPTASISAKPLSRTISGTARGMRTASGRGLSGNRRHRPTAAKMPERDGITAVPVRPRMVEHAAEACRRGAPPVLPRPVIGEGQSQRVNYAGNPSVGADPDIVHESHRLRGAREVAEFFEVKESWPHDIAVDTLNDIDLAGLSDLICAQGHAR